MIVDIIQAEVITFAGLNLQNKILNHKQIMEAAPAAEDKTLNHKQTAEILTAVEGKTLPKAAVQIIVVEMRTRTLRVPKIIETIPKIQVVKPLLTEEDK